MAKQRDLPVPVGRKTKTSRPFKKSKIAYASRITLFTAAEGSLAPNPGKLTSPIEAAISLLA